MCSVILRLPVIRQMGGMIMTLSRAEARDGIWHESTKK